MKVLLFTDKGHDYIASTLYFGLCEVLGSENVIDFMGSPPYHPPYRENVDFPIYRYSYYPGTPRQEELLPFERRVLPFIESGEIAAVFIFFSWERSYSWDIVRYWISRIRSNPKIAFINGDDRIRPSTAPPEFLKSYVFQREILHSQNYPYKPIPLYMAIPERELVTSLGNPHIDISYLGNPSHPSRAEVAQVVSRSQKLRFLVSNGSLLGWPEYIGVSRQSKFVFCPPGAGWDCFRTYEAAAAGAIPVFLHPDCSVISQPHFYPLTTAIYGKNVEVAVRRVEESVESGTWKERRRLVWSHTHEYHTTRARAQYVLKEMNLL